MSRTKKEDEHYQEDKTKIRQSLELDIEEFLAKGGSVQVLSPNASSRTLASDAYEELDDDIKERLGGPKIDLSLIDEDF